MLSEIGNFFLALTFGFCGVQVLVSLWGLIKKDDKFLCLGKAGAYLQSFCLMGAFFTLILAFLLCDFSIMTVALHDHIELPWYYRLAATWGNHEGSLLLFVLVLSLTASGFAYFLKMDLFKARSLVTQGFLILIFLLFLVLTSNPFISLPFPPVQGESLNPLLQDRGLWLHPPVLYLGYVGFAAPYSLAIAALWGKEEAYIGEAILRPWALLAWACLTVGITFGSWWAYYELGWGGWWFWDPVENASLMPWLAGTALLHTLRSEKLYRWSLFLSILSFCLSLLGTFLVRSSLITSVHNFATSPERGLCIMSIIGITLGIGLVMWVWKAPRPSGPLVNFISRQGALTLNFLFLMMGLVVLLLGTFYPLWSEWAWGEIVSVGTPYFERTLIPLMLPFLILIPIGVLLRDEKESRLALFITPLTASLGAAVLLLYLFPSPHYWTWVGCVISVWIFAGTLVAYLKKRLSLGPTLAHLGVAITLFSISFGSGYRIDESKILGLHDQMQVGHLTLTLEDIQQGKESTYLYQKAKLSYQGGVLTPEKRLYQPQNALLSETAIGTHILRDLYVIFGPYQGDNRWLVRASVIPFAPWIWIGGLFMMMGALVSLVKRRAILSALLICLPLSSMADKDLDKKAVEIQQEVRCPVCLGQSIADSDTAESEALRVYIQEQLKQGKSEHQIREDLREKLGNEILFRPPFEQHTYFLWLAPFVIFFLCVAWVIWRVVKSSRQKTP